MVNLVKIKNIIICTCIIGFFNSCNSNAEDFTNSNNTSQALVEKSKNNNVYWSEKISMNYIDEKHCNNILK